MKFIIGYSDYSKHQIDSGNAMGGFGDYEELIDAIAIAQEDGWTVKFETNLFRWLFLMAKYRVVAIKP